MDMTSNRKQATPTPRALTGITRGFVALLMTPASAAPTRRMPAQRRTTDR